MSEKNQVCGYRDGQLVLIMADGEKFTLPNARVWLAEWLMTQQEENDWTLPPNVVIRWGDQLIADSSLKN